MLKMHDRVISVSSDEFWEIRAAVWRTIFSMSLPGFRA
jgi:hypothetical protein